MARLVFHDLKPISINSAYYRNRKITDKARVFRSKFLTQLQSQLPSLSEIQSKFNPMEHCLDVSYTFYTPNEYFFTKSGHLSHRSQDLDNCVKLITDFIFNKKYNTAWLKGKKGREKALYSSLSSLNNCAIDDKFIQKMPLEKLPNLSYGIVVDIQLKGLPKRAEIDHLEAFTK